MAFKRAVKNQAKLRLALCGLAGAGKTFSSLAIASGIADAMFETTGKRGRIAVIDTETGSASLYAKEFDFDVVEMVTFSPLAYVEKIKEAEAEGYDILVIDSLSHAWVGKDGALDQKDKATERSASGNSWTAWRSVTPKHNELVDAMLHSKCHVIATMRQKMEYVQETTNGKVDIKKVGLASIQREGMEYEFTAVGDIDLTNTLRISKTRLNGVLSPGDIFEKPGASLARKIYGWLMDGEVRAPASAPPLPPAAVASPQPANDGGLSEVDRVFAEYLGAIAEAPDRAALEALSRHPAKPPKGTRQYAIALAAFTERGEWIAKQSAPAQHAVAS